MRYSDELPSIGVFICTHFFSNLASGTASILADE